LPDEVDRQNNETFIPSLYAKQDTIQKSIADYLNTIPRGSEKVSELNWEPGFFLKAFP